MHTRTYMSASVASKALELLDYARSRYKDELGYEGIRVNQIRTVHILSLNGVEIALIECQHVLGVTVNDTAVLYEARGACVPITGKGKFLVFGAHDLAGRPVDPFLVTVYSERTAELIVREDALEHAEALFRMLLTLAIGW